MAVSHTAANVHDSKVLEEVIDAIEPIRKPRRWASAHAFQEAACRQGIRLPSMSRGFEEEHNPRIARRGIEYSEKLGRYRWVVQRTLSWVNRNRRLKVRYERCDAIHQAFLDLGCALICWRYVQRLS